MLKVTWFKTYICIFGPNVYFEAIKYIHFYTCSSVLNTAISNFKISLTEIAPIKTNSCIALKEFSKTVDKCQKYYQSRLENTFQCFPNGFPLHFSFLPTWFSHSTFENLVPLCCILLKIPFPHSSRMFGQDFFVVNP